MILNENARTQSAQCIGLIACAEIPKDLWPDCFSNNFLINFNHYKVLLKLSFRYFDEKPTRSRRNISFERVYVSNNRIYF